MKPKRTLHGDFDADDVFTMGETGLYWRQSPSSSLATIAGRDKDRSRLNIICCCNYTGGNRFPLWAVGTWAQSSSLRGVSLEALNVQFRSDSNAWISVEIMKDWLQAFYKWIGARRVLLLMDGTRAHMGGIEQMSPPSNICIQLLPSHSTSSYQPLDQGIVYQFKRCYKKLWLSFMLSCYEQGYDPGINVNLFLALSWASQSWFHDLRHDSVFHSFFRTRIQPIQEPHTLPDMLEELQKEQFEQLYELVLQAGNIRDAMHHESFLNPASEADKPIPSDRFDLAEAIAKYSRVPAAARRSEEGVRIQAPTAAEAEKAAETLLLYISHQGRATDSQIKTVRQLYELAGVQKSERAKVLTLDNWLNS